MYLLTKLFSMWCFRLHWKFNSPLKSKELKNSRPVPAMWLWWPSRSEPSQEPMPSGTSSKSLVIFTFWKKRIVFCFKNCFDLPWEKVMLVIENVFLKFEAEGRELANILRSLFRKIYSNSKRSNKFLKIIGI